MKVRSELSKVVISFEMREEDTTYQDPPPLNNFLHLIVTLIGVNRRTYKTNANRRPKSKTGEQSTGGEEATQRNC